MQNGEDSSNYMKVPRKMIFYKVGWLRGCAYGEAQSNWLDIKLLLRASIDDDCSFGTASSGVSGDETSFAGLR